MDIGTVVAWVQMVFWVFAGIVWIIKWKYGGAKMHPVLIKAANSKFALLTLILLGICFSGWTVWSEMGWHIGARTRIVNISEYVEGQDTNVNLVQNQEFRDQMVPLDGYVYKNVTFINTCFAYYGGAFELQNVTLSGYTRVCVRSQDLRNYFDLMDKLGAFDPRHVKSVPMHTVLTQP